MEEKAIGGKSVYQRNLYTSKSKILMGRSITSWLGLAVYRLAIAGLVIVLVVPLFLIMLIAWILGKQQVLGYPIRKQQEDLTNDEVSWTFESLKEEQSTEWLDLADGEVPIIDFGVDNYGNLLISPRNSDEWDIVGRDM